jgi:hypothetical protein
MEFKRTIRSSYAGEAIADALADKGARLVSDTTKTVNGKEVRNVVVERTAYWGGTYSELVSILIRKRYSVDDELALLRQQTEKPDEYKAYYDFAEECKTKAKALIAERDAYYASIA